MKQNVIVLSAKNWALTDEQTGQQRAGISIHYVMSDNLADFTDIDGTRGYQPAKQSIPVDKAQSLVKVPGVYEAEFLMRASGGKNVLSISDLRYIGSVTGSVTKVGDK